MAVRARRRAHAQFLSLENPEPRDVADSVLRNRRTDDRHIEAHIFARDLVEIDDLEGPAAPHKRRGAVIAANLRGLKPCRCHLPRGFGTFIAYLAVNW